jgi:hypothetical protein
LWPAGTWTAAGKLACEYVLAAGIVEHALTRTVAAAARIRRDGIMVKSPGK